MDDSLTGHGPTPDADATVLPPLGAAVRTTIGHFEILGHLGAGGMGVVYKARDTTLERIVALKLLQDRSRGDEAVRRRLLREARAAARLDHPGICPVFSVEEEGASLCIVMQYLEGRSLKEVLVDGPVPLPVFFDVARQVTDALGAAHAEGLIHRDMKPANVMVTKDGKAKIVDFGIAHSMDATDVSSLNPSGTLVYLAPEVLHGHAADVRTDLFSLGVMFYEMLSGQNPFAGPTSAAVLSNILHLNPPSLSQGLPGVPEAIARLVARMVDKDREKRPASARDVADALEAAQRPAQGAAPTASTASRAPVPSRRRSMLVASVGAVALLGIAGATYLVFGSSRASLSSHAAPQQPPSASLPATPGPVTASPTAAVPQPVDLVAAKPAKPAIAALPFSFPQNDPAWTPLAMAIPDAITNGLAQSRRFRTVERAQLDKVQQELRLNQSGAVDPATAQRVGKLVGATYLVLGSYQVLQGQLRINARLISVETSDVVAAQTMTGTAAEALNLADRLARAFLAQLEK